MNRNIRLLYLHNFLIDFRFQDAFLVIYFAQVTGSYALAMTIMGTAMVTSALMDIPTGIMSDKKGRRFTIIAASLCNALSVSCYAMASDATLLFAGAALAGLAECMFNGNNSALIFESLKSEGKEERFSHYAGRASSMYQVGLCLSAFVGSLMTVHGLRFIIAVGIIPQIIAIAVGLLFHEPKIHKAPHRENWEHLKQSFLQVYHNPRLRLLMLSQAFSYGAGEATWHFRSAYINLLVPTWAISLFKGLNHVFGFTGFWFSGFIIDRIKAARVLIICDTYWLVTQYFAFYLSNWVTPFILVTGGTFFGPNCIAARKLMQLEFTDEQRGVMGSIGTVISSIVYALSAFLIGLIADQYSITAAICVGLGLSLISLPLNIKLFRKYI